MYFSHFLLLGFTISISAQLVDLPTEKDPQSTAIIPPQIVSTNNKNAEIGFDSLEAEADDDGIIVGGGASDFRSDSPEDEEEEAVIILSQTNDDDNNQHCLLPKNNGDADSDSDNNNRRPPQTQKRRLRPRGDRCRNQINPPPSSSSSSFQEGGEPKDGSAAGSGGSNHNNPSQEAGAAADQDRMTGNPSRTNKRPSLPPLPARTPSSSSQETDSDPCSNNGERTYAVCSPLEPTTPWIFPLSLVWSTGSLEYCRLCTFHSFFSSFLFRNYYFFFWGVGGGR